MDNIGTAWTVAVLSGIVIVYACASFIFYCLNPDCWGMVGRSTSVAIALLWVGAMSWLAWRRYAE